MEGVATQGRGQDVSFVSVARIHGSGSLIWGPFSFGQPLSQFYARGAALGADGRFYTLHSTYDAISKSYTSTLSCFEPDGSRKGTLWPRELGITNPVQIRCDARSIYVIGTSKYRSIPQTTGLECPTITSFDYRGNESALKTAQFHAEGENWAEVDLIPTGSDFFTLGYVVLNSFTKAENHGITIRKYDRYGIPQ
jgi:hypothetical protein